MHFLWWYFEVPSEHKGLNNNGIQSLTYSKNSEPKLTLPLSKRNNWEQKNIEKCYSFTKYNSRPKI